MKFVISSGKGGVGKSMLASSLAILFSKKHQIVAVDADVDAPNLAIWLGETGRWDKVEKISTSEKPVFDYKKCIGCGTCVENCQFEALKMVNNKPRLNKFTCEGCGACEILCPQKAIKLKPVKNGEIKTKFTKYGFKLITGQLYPGETGSGKIVSEIKERAKIYPYKLMIIDSSPGTGCPVIAALQDMDFVILVTEPTPSAFSDLKRVLEVVKYFKLPYGIVINKWDIYPKLTQKIKKEFKKKFLGQISYDQEIFKAVSQLKPIMETNLKAKKEIQQIFTKLNCLI
jgi:MinD superfamily P-loop ATPase